LNLLKLKISKAPGNLFIANHNHRYSLEKKSANNQRFCMFTSPMLTMFLLQCTHVWSIIS